MNGMIVVSIPSETTVTVEIGGEVDVIRARREGRALGRQLGFSVSELVIVPAVISELAGNILRYAGHGELRITAVRDGGRTGIEVVAADSGPGIADVNLAMQDGYSSSGGVGLGLPGVRRLVDDFEICTAPGEAAVIRIIKWRSHEARDRRDRALESPSPERTALMAGRPLSAPNFPRVLSRRLEGMGEDALLEAYEEGRRALQGDASLVDLVGAFGDALLDRLAMCGPDEAATAVKSGLDIMREAVVPFQMTVEGYRSAIAEVEDRVRKRTAELETAKGEAEAASRAKSEFLSRMSHELRTPLNAVLGFAQLLGLDELTTDQRGAVSDILNAGQHLLVLVNEVLDLARVEAGHLSVSMEPVCIIDVVTESLALLAPLAGQHDISLGVDPRSASDLHVRADRHRLAQVVLNLVSNAVKYNRPGGDVTVGWRLVSETEVRLAVRDSGIGIAPPLMARLFQPFERLDANPTIEGTGLGLALCRCLVDAMGGRIGAESEPRQGSTFWVDLATGFPREQAIRQADPAPPAGRIPTPIVVLYVEANAANVRLVGELLGCLPGVTLLTATDGSAAVELAVRHQPDLILLDLRLPDLSGEEVLARLRSTPRTRAIPVVVVSADATADQVSALVAAGATEHLTKPLDVPALLAVVAGLRAARE